MTELMHAWPTLTVMAAAIAGALSAVRALRSWRPRFTTVHALQRGDIDPTALLHLAPGPGSLASLRETEPDTHLMTSDVASERVAAEELAHVEHERREADAFFADFRKALDAAVLEMFTAVEPAERKARLWHLRNGGRCDCCPDFRAIAEKLRDGDEWATGEHPLYVGVARVPALTGV